MPDTHTISDSRVKDPLFAYTNEDYKNTREKLAKYRNAKKDTVQNQRELLMQLIGPDLEPNAANLLNPKAAWIETIQGRSSLGMLATVCKWMSKDIKLRKMDKTNEDRVNAVVIQIKGENCDAEPAIGICFPKDEVDCVMPKFVLSSTIIVQTSGIFKKGVLGCNCPVSSSFETQVKLSLVSKGLCIRSEIQKTGMEMFLRFGDTTVGVVKDMCIHHRVLTPSPFGGFVHKRIDSLMNLKDQLVHLLWNQTGIDGVQLKKAVSTEFARLESTTWRTGAAQGGKTKKYKITEVSSCVRVSETMHGPTSFLLRVKEGSVTHNKFIATKNMLLANTKEIIHLLPDAKFYSNFIDDLNSYVECLERQRRNSRAT
jgi:hypothetical protein